MNVINKIKINVFKKIGIVEIPGYDFEDTTFVGTQKKIYSAAMLLAIKKFKSMKEDLILKFS